MPMKSRSARPAIARHAHHARPGRVSIGRAMSCVIAYRLGRDSADGRMADPLQVEDAWPGAELLEDVVGAAALRQGGDPARRVAQVAEDDRRRRARLLAGGADLAVGERPPGELDGALARLDALHAQAALLHDAARAHGDV